jgi:hypothetical protein
VISVDPIYQFTGAEIRDRVTATYDEVIAKVHQNQARICVGHASKIPNTSAKNGWPPWRCF